MSEIGAPVRKYVSEKCTGFFSGVEVVSGLILPKFRRNILPPSWGFKFERIYTNCSV